MLVVLERFFFSHSDGCEAVGARTVVENGEEGRRRQPKNRKTERKRRENGEKTERKRRENREKERVDERETKRRGWMLMILIINSDPSIRRPWRSGIPATNVNSATT